MANAEESDEVSNISESLCLFIPPHLLEAVQAKRELDSQVEQEDSEAGYPQPYIGKIVHVPRTKDDDGTIEQNLKLAIQDLPKPAASDSPNRHIFDLQCCSRAEDFPGQLMRSEGEQAIEDPQYNSVNECFDNMGIVCNFFREALEDTEVFCEGTPLIGIVHYSFYFPGAWWHRLEDRKLARVIVFGDGWENDPWNNGKSTSDFGGCFGNFTGSLEVVAHEMGHAYVQSILQLGTRYDPGALNEHIADVIGAMVEQWHKKQTVTEADWLIGEDLIAPTWKGISLRSMKEPGSAYKLQNIGIGDDPQVASMKAKEKTERDAGGVHINSGILNRAFYLAAMEFGGHSWEKAGRIWLGALQDSGMTTSCSFELWARLTADVAKNTFGKDAKEIVKRAWKEVGITVT